MCPAAEGNRILVSWLAVLGYLALIFGLSSLASLATPGSSGHVDKLAHLAEYGLLGALVVRAWFRTLPGRPVAWIVLTILVGITVGALDELWQGQHGRDSSVADWVADTVGASLAALILVRSRIRGGALGRWWLSGAHAEGRRST